MLHFFIPLCFRPFFDPIQWSIKYVLGAFEPVEARCTGLIRKDKGEDGYSYYPLFAYTDPQRGRMQWHTSREKAKKHFRMGEIYTLSLAFVALVMFYCAVISF